MKSLKNGDRVTIDSYEGFGGPATIIATRPSEGSRYRVQMDDDNPPPFWAHDFEIVELREPKVPDPPGLAETKEHIGHVQRIMGKAIDDMSRRSDVHDASKLASPEAEMFEEVHGKLHGITFGSPEYAAQLALLKPALDHHYSRNSHHPQHHPDGIRGMSLADVYEMLIDWKASTLRHADGDIRRSIEINQLRFGYSDELKQILLNTLPIIEG